MIGKWQVRLAGVMLSLAVTAGCGLGGGDDGVLKELGKDEKATIKVMYYDERSFYDQYGMLFSALHPNITVEVVSTQSIRYEEGVDMEAEMDKFIEEQQPDILMLSAEKLKTMAEDGELYDLEPVMAQDKFDTETLLSGLVDYLKEYGGGKLYGMAPTFYSQAVFYNKDLFDEYGVPYPTDRMSWTDLLQLAQRFPTDGSDEERVYGLKAGYNSDLYDLGSSIGQTLELKMFNPEKQQVTIDTAGWREVYDQALAAIQSNSLYFERMNESMPEARTYEDYLLEDPFISGRLAMTIDSLYMMGQIEEAAEYFKNEPDKVVQNWAMVTMPVNPQNPEYGTNISLSEIFAINSQSPNTRAAWEFIKYVTSDEYARVNALSGVTGQLSTRTTALKDDEGRNKAALYALKPSMSNFYEDFGDLPDNFFSRYYQLATEELKKAEDGEASVSEALASLQEKAQAALLEEQQKEASAMPDPNNGG